MRKMLLITLEWPPMHGGVSEYLSGLFRALPEDRVAVLYDKSVLEGHGRLRWLSTIPKALNMAKETEAEMIAVSHLLPMGYVALFLKIFQKLPYIVFVHGLDLKMLKRNPWKRFLGKLILKNAERVIANSHHTESLAKAYCSTPEHITVVHPCPSGPAMQKTNPENVAKLRKKYGLGDEPVIITICRLVERKGVDTVISDLEAIGKFCSNVKYLVVGDGPDRERLKRLAREYHVQDKVIFTGEVDADEIADHFALGDVFVMLARETDNDVEGFGIVYLEAGHHRLPVIAGRSGGVPEAVLDGKTGVLVDPGGGDEVVSAICGLIKDKNLARRLGETSHQRVQDEFTWAHQAERFMDVIS